MQRLGVLLLPIWLAACAGYPPQLALVTQIADGVSYVFTGKSGTDHIISAAMKKNCAFSRMVQGMPICRDKRDNLALSQVEGGHPGAALFSPPERDEMVPLGHNEVVSLDPVRLPHGMADIAPALGGAARAPYEPVMGAAAFTQPRQLLLPARQPKASAQRTPRPMARQTPLPPPDSSYYVVVGSFRNRAGALVVAARQGRGVTSIVAVMRNGAKTHRVLIGPFDRVRAGATRRLVRERGIRGAWLIRSCTNGPTHGRRQGCMDIPKT